MASISRVYMRAAHQCASRNACSRDSPRHCPRPDRVAAKVPAPNSAPLRAGPRARLPGPPSPTPVARRTRVCATPNRPFDMSADGDERADAWTGQGVHALSSNSRWCGSACTVLALSRASRVRGRRSRTRRGSASRARRRAAVRRGRPSLDIIRVNMARATNS
jgi:hypothetical protein